MRLRARLKQMAAPFLLGLVSGLFPAPAALAQSLEADMARCMTVPDEQARLRCFEALVPGTTAAPDESKTSPAPVPSPAPVARKAPTANPEHRTPSETAPASSGSAADEDSFGFSLERQRIREEEAKARQRAARRAQGEQVDDRQEKEAAERRDEIVARVSRDHRGRLLITTESAQLWRQIDELRIPDPRPGDSLELRKGFPGGFMLRVNRRTIRVERLK